MTEERKLGAEAGSSGAVVVHVYRTAIEYQVVVPDEETNPLRSAIDRVEAGAVPEYATLSQLVAVVPDREEIIGPLEQRIDELERALGDLVRGVKVCQVAHDCPGFDCATCTPSTEIRTAEDLLEGRASSSSPSSEAAKPEPTPCELEAVRDEGRLSAFRKVAEVLGAPWIDKHGVLDHVRSLRRRNSDLEGHVAAHAKALRVLTRLVRRSEDRGVDGAAWERALARAEELVGRDLAVTSATPCGSQPGHGGAPVVPTRREDRSRGELLRSLADANERLAAAREREHELAAELEAERRSVDELVEGLAKSHEELAGALREASRDLADPAAWERLAEAQEAHAQETRRRHADARSRRAGVAGGAATPEPDCEHESWSGDEGPVALLGRMPRRWRCDDCGLVREDEPAEEGPAHLEPVPGVLDVLRPPLPSPDPAAPPIAP